MAVRLNININEETEQALQELAKRKNLSVTELVRRAVSVYKFVEDETNVGHKTMQLVDPATKQVTTVAMVG